MRPVARHVPVGIEEQLRRAPGRELIVGVVSRRARHVWQYSLGKTSTYGASGKDSAPRVTRRLPLTRPRNAGCAFLAYLNSPAERRSIGYAPFSL